MSEECDIGVWEFTGEDSSGYIGVDATFDPDPKTNTDMLLGCTSTCTVEAGFRCPIAADVKANGSWALNTCTDRCGDGVFDGIFTERANDYPTGSTLNWADYAVGATDEAGSGVTFSAYIAAEY